MKQFSTTEELYAAMRNPAQKELENIAINLIRNFCIIKNEADSYGVRQVRYNIVELEVYFYNKENDDWPTYNRDCVAGQWHFHRSGVDIAFQTLHEGTELTQFGGVLIRGLERIVDGKVEGYIGGPQRCQFEIFNSSTTMPSIEASDALENIAICKHRRVNIPLDSETGNMFRYFRFVNISDWDKPQKTIFTDKLIVKKEHKAQKYKDAPYHGMGEVQVYPMATDIVCFSEYIKSYKCWADIETVLRTNNIPYQLLPETKDLWARDFMPIQRPDGTFVNYIYNPDYLQKYQDWITSDVRKCFDFTSKKITDLDIVMDGGNVIMAGEKVIMTDKVLSENKDKSEEKIRRAIEQALGCELVIIPWDKGEKYGHADGMVRYVEPNHVLINYYSDIDEPLREKILKALKPHFAKISELKYGKNARVNSWAHINFLQIGQFIFVPQLDIASDAMALEQISAIYKYHHIVPVRADGIVRNDGALNCVSWNVRI